MTPPCVTHSRGRTAQHKAARHSSACHSMHSTTVTHATALAMQYCCVQDKECTACHGTSLHDEQAQHSMTQHERAACMPYGQGRMATSSAEDTIHSVSWHLPASHTTGTVQHGTAWCGTAWPCVVRYHMAQHLVRWYPPCPTLRAHSTIWHSTVLMHQSS